MRLTVLAFAMLPATAFAQDTALPTPSNPVAQSQTCPAGTAWDANAAACASTSQSVVPAMGSGCSYGAAREVTS
ncbi:hypothetical protein AN191_12540 [Loktanella sp. 5RATIMAR09]|uniref:hypothetical protein n=1 Tax=Loktanella sp. 5RATIMAR09 TaxID=1225655 RepID=UPI0006EB9658|nr:hypothetical protein [Loktanella sp. 5RATIMAR09]KQI71445.1 hypothetical protein AN191_12540 [Loktanella sp. 5RATIMAR09]